MTIFDEIAVFLERTGMTRSAFGQTVGGETSYLSKLRNGHLRLTEARIEKMRAFMADNHDMVCTVRGPYRPQASGSGVNVEHNPDLWEQDAEVASRMLLAAIRQHHPARCAA